MDAAAYKRGLIPACAGKTVPPKDMALRPWAHPRVCGENNEATNFSHASQGSSPRVRGKQEGRL